jgi:DNA uptake protein ComE-like DNA-binding protein
MRNLVRPNLAQLVIVAFALTYGGAFAQAPQPAIPSTAPTPARAPANAPASAPQPAGELLDINSASLEQLDALPGVGAARAEAIVRGRPFKGKDELYRKKIVPKNVYEQIKDKIIAKQK